MKVFFDIGTNCFQGYMKLADELNINDEWDKIFVEPNPRFMEVLSLSNKLKNITKSKYIPAALCCSCNEKTMKLLSMSNNDTLDQGATIFPIKQDSRHINIDTVDVISFDDLCKDYMQHEWYIKFDCENCEYDCLENIILKYHDNIKFIACEFHVPPPLGKEMFQIKILSLANKFNINFRIWEP